MKRRFSEEQIIDILKEHEAGISAEELRRKHDMSDAGFYKWKATFGGMEVSDARRLRDLEAENAKHASPCVGAMGHTLSVKLDHFTTFSSKFNNLSY